MSDASPSAQDIIRIAQAIDPEGIARTDDLGPAFNLLDAVPGFSRAVEFLRGVPLESVQRLPEGATQQLKNAAERLIEMHRQLLAFKPESLSNPAQEQQNLIATSNRLYDELFSNVSPIVSFAQLASLDFGAIKDQAQDKVNEATLELMQLVTDLRTSRDQAKTVLSEIRDVAAQSGVAKQAGFFDAQALVHEKGARDWQMITVGAAVILAAFAGVSLWVSFTWPATDPYQAIQFGISKALIFSAIAYLLYLASRTLMAHRHNEVVNRHRNNALLTFNALSEAASSEQTREVVLTHASACIFGPQETGFSKASAAANTSIIDVLPRVMGQPQG